jgi:hypothetical protein
MERFAGNLFHVPSTLMAELSSSDVSLVLVSMDVTAVIELELVVKNAEMMLVLNQNYSVEVTVDTVIGNIGGKKKNVSIGINL